jgi:hypothetical protein
MIKQTLFAFSLIMTAFSAKADLGDTYARSCFKYGSQGYVDKKDRTVIWKVSHHLVAESFYKNECVRITFIPEQGSYYTVSDVERIAPDQSGLKQTWTPFDGGDAYAACWMTTDGLIGATLYYNGSVQFSYSWWLKAKGLATEPVHISPPIEDNPITIEHKDSTQM